MYLETHKTTEVKKLLCSFIFGKKWFIYGIFAFIGQSATKRHKT